jgi:hypothetical protein
VVKVNPVKQHQSLKMLELADNVICSSCGLTALNSPDADSNVGAVDHIDIVGAVSNGESPAPFFDDGGDFLLAFGRDPAADDADGLFEDIGEHIFGMVVKLSDELATENSDFVTRDDVEHIFDVFD